MSLKSLADGTLVRPGNQRVLRARIKCLSLVKKGANKMPVLYKDGDEKLIEYTTLMKAAGEDAGELLTVTFAPEYRDDDMTIASAEVVKEMAYSHAESGFKLDLFHDGNVLTPEQAFIAESFIIQKGDPRFLDWKDIDGKPVDVAGGWGNVIKLKSPELRAAVRSGDLSGVSVYGPAVVALNKSTQMADHLSLRLRGETQLELTALVALLKTAFEDQTKTIVSALKPGETGAANPKLAELEVALKKNADESAATTKALAEANAKIVVLEKSVADEKAAKAVVDAKLAEIQKNSNIPGSEASLTLVKSASDHKALAGDFAGKYLRTAKK